MILNIFLGIIALLNLAIGLGGLYFYITHPLLSSGLVEYKGGKSWLFFAITFGILLYRVCG